MGQRHQIFIRTLNPLKQEHYWDKDNIAKARKALGYRKHTVLAFHHQWLYGRSAVAQLENIMKFTDPETSALYSNPFNPVNGAKCNVGGHRDSYEGWMSAVMMLLQTQTNPKHPRGIGIERMLYLNDDEPEMRGDFTRGDNNDGITIIDVPSRRYCMMNPFEPYSTDDLSQSSDDLPTMMPVSAHEYAKAYYPESVGKLSRYQSENLKTDEARIKYLNDNVDENLDVVKGLYQYGVLTTNELKKMFPKVYKELEVSN